MIDISQWAGPQWVLVTLWAASIAASLVVYAAGKVNTNFPEWLGGRLSVWGGYAFMAAILAWGGFWQ